MRVDSKMFNEVEDTSSISTHLGFPLGLYPCGEDPPWHTTPSPNGFDPFTNPEALSLLLGIDPSRSMNESWNKANFTNPSKPDELVTWVLVFRKDKNAIYRQQVEALVGFCGDVLQNAMDDKDNDFDEDINQMIVKEYVSREKFHEYFDTFRNRKLAAWETSWTYATIPMAGRVLQAVYPVPG